jgi:hypothetical protein
MPDNGALSCENPDALLEFPVVEGESLDVGLLMSWFPPSDDAITMNRIYDTSNIRMIIGFL